MKRNHVVFSVTSSITDRPLINAIQVQKRLFSQRIKSITKNNENDIFHCVCHHTSLNSPYHAINSSKQRSLLFFNVKFYSMRFNKQGSHTKEPNSTNRKHILLKAVQNDSEFRTGHKKSIPQKAQKDFHAAFELFLKNRAKAKDVMNCILLNMQAVSISQLNIFLGITARKAKYNDEIAQIIRELFHKMIEETYYDRETVGIFMEYLFNTKNYEQIQYIYEKYFLSRYTPQSITMDIAYYILTAKARRGEVEETLSFFRTYYQSYLNGYSLDTLPLEDRVTLEITRMLSRARMYDLEKEILTNHPITNSYILSEYHSAKIRFVDETASDINTIMTEFRNRFTDYSQHTKQETMEGNPYSELEEKCIYIPLSLVEFLTGVHTRLRMNVLPENVTRAIFQYYSKELKKTLLRGKLRRMELIFRSTIAYDMHEESNFFPTALNSLQGKERPRLSSPTILAWLKKLSHNTSSILNQGHGPFIDKSCSAQMKLKPNKLTINDRIERNYENMNSNDRILMNNIEAEMNELQRDIQSLNDNKEHASLKYCFAQLHRILEVVKLCEISQAKQIYTDLSTKLEKITISTFRQKYSQTN